MIQTEMQENERLLNSAIASVEMEGFHLSDYERCLCLDAINDKITKDEFIRAVLERCTV